MAYSHLRSNKKKTLFFLISYTVNKFSFGGLFGATLFVLFANDFSV